MGKFRWARHGEQKHPAVDQTMGRVLDSLPDTVATNAAASTPRQLCEIAATPVLEDIANFDRLL